MAQGKFSQPRNRSAAPASPAHPPRKKVISPDEDATMILPKQADAAPSGSSDTNEELDALLRQLNTPQSDPEPEAPVQEAAPPVYNHEIPQADFPEEEGPDAGEDDLPSGFSEQVTDFFRNHRKGMLIAVFAVVAIVLAGITTAIVVNLGGSKNDPYGKLILSNVYVGDVNVGGMTRSEAVSAVKKATVNTFQKEDMVVQFSEEDLHLSPSKTKAKLDVPAAVDAAYAYGRTGTQAEQQRDYEASLTETHTIGLLPYLTLDTDYIQQALEDYAGKYAGQFVQSGYTLEGEKPDLSAEGFNENTPCQTLVLTIGTPGFGLDIQELSNKILNAYSLNQFQVVVGDIPENAEPDPLDLDAIYAEVHVDPVDPSLDPNTFETIPGTSGYGFDLEQAKAQLAAANYGDTVRIPLSYIAPAQQDSLLFQDVLGSCETPHNDNENRNTNLRIVCSTLNGLVLNPGETFSYNETLGQRTAEKGYLPAPAYSGQELVDVRGGGICQGSSTLYYCALLADMTIVERINHGFPASYMDLGMDATVSWGGPDLKFTNSSQYPIKIQAEVSDGYVKMKILGTETRNYYVKMEYEVTGRQAPETVYEVHKPGEGYTDGQVIQSGKSAIYVKSYKLKYDRVTNQLLSKDFETRSSYQSKKEIIAKVVSDETTPPSSEVTTPPSSEVTTPSTEAPTTPPTEATTAPSTEATTSAQETGGEASE